MKYYAIKHKNEKRWIAYKIPSSQLKDLRDDYEWRGPFESVFKAMVSVNEEKEKNR